MNNVSIQLTVKMEVTEEEYRHLLQLWKDREHGMLLDFLYVDRLLDFLCVDRETDVELITLKGK